jgi:hypothetical protein
MPQLQNNLVFTKADLRWKQRYLGGVHHLPGVIRPNQCLTHTAGPHLQKVNRHRWHYRECARAGLLYSRPVCAVIICGNDWRHRLVPAGSTRSLSIRTLVNF